MISYTSDLDPLGPGAFDGFFVGWPHPPSATTLKTLLSQAPYVSLALDDHHLIGFCYAISDGLLSAYIPLLEVRPDYQKQGIGKALVLHLMAQLKHHYMIDLCCDSELEPFYNTLGFHPVRGMIYRNYKALEPL